MARIGIWEGEGEALAPALAPFLPEGAVVARHPAAFAQGRFDLLAVAPSAAGWAGAGVIRCRTALLPGSALPLARVLSAESAVSYGGSPRNTLTISSLEGRQICVALQRAVLALTGATLERQEFALPFPAGEDPERFLALTGAKLLLTGKP